MPPPSSLPVQSKPGLAALPRRGNNALWGIVNSAASGSQPRSTTSLQPNGFPISSNSNIRGPADKHALSLRLLLTQAEETVEGFSDKITRVIKDVSEARTEVQETGRLFEEGQSQILSETRLLG
jgi:flagellar hook-basal body complex protein FliE